MPVPAMHFDFYRQAFKQVMSQPGAAEVASLFQVKSGGVAYPLATVLPEALPFHFRSGEFALQPADNIYLDVAVFVIGDAAALYFLLGEEWMPEK